MKRSDDPVPATHNGGPPLEDPPEHVPEWGDGDPNIYFQWKAAVKRARRSQPLDIVMFRLSRAEAAGVDYETYVTEILERGVRLQANDVQADDLRRARLERLKARPRAIPRPLR